MAQRRKIEVSVTNKSDVGLDYQTVANDVAKLYHKALNLQPVSFDSGRRHSLTKVYDWIKSQKQDGKAVTSTDVITFVQNEINELLLTNPAFAQRVESNHSGMSREACLEANAGSSSSTASIENVPQEMEEDPPHV